MFVAGFYGRYSGKNAELKFKDTTVALTASATAGVILFDSLNIIAEGNGESARIGRKLTIKKIQIKGSWANVVVTTAATTDQRLRIILYLDQQTNGTAATVVGVLESASINAFRNLANSSRFQVLMDKTLTVRNQYVGQTAAGAFTTTVETRSWSFYKNCNIDIEYDNSATTGVLTSQRTNNLGIMILSETASSPPLVGFTCRLRYSDQ